MWRTARSRLESHATEQQFHSNLTNNNEPVLNLGHLDFEIVSDFDIRISDFNHSGCFIQNKPNLLNTQMNVTSFITKDYENKSNWKLGENKANTKPIYPYRRGIKANTNPISEKPKMKLNSYSTKDYENEPRLRTPAKQTQSNPTCSELACTELGRSVERI